MRLWHYKLIPYLPKQWLMGQHREIAGLRGKGWGKKHKTVDYVFLYPYEDLYLYHVVVMDTLKHKHGVSVDIIWYDSGYRGKELRYDESDITLEPGEGGGRYEEFHNDKYLAECLANLKNKGVIITMEG